MSGLLKFVLPADLRAMKNRVHPSVVLIDALVQSTRSLDPSLRSGWVAFVSEWRGFFSADDSDRTSAQYDAGEELERKLRGWKSLLSSQCFGVPSPAAKREIAMFTWATPDAVREQKARVEPRVRELATKAARTPQLTAAFRDAWRQLLLNWTAFANEPEEWTHAAAQLDCALAYEDVLPEWEEAMGLAAATPSELGTAMADRAVPDVAPRGVAPGLPAPKRNDAPSLGGGAAPPWGSPSEAAPPALFADAGAPGSGGAMAVGAIALVFGLALARRGRR